MGTNDAIKLDQLGTRFQELGTLLRQTPGETATYKNLATVLNELTDIKDRLVSAVIELLEMELDDETLTVGEKKP